MGLFLTLLYILTAYLGPETLWGSLYQYHIEVILAALALVASIPRMQDSKILSIFQSYALVGMCVAVFCSMVMTGWLGSILPAVLGFIPSVFSFYLIVINCRKKGHIQAIVLTLFIASAFTIYKGYTALQADNYFSPYVMAQGAEGGLIYRLRGLGFINDPNDFAQVMVSLIPCMFFFWKKGNFLSNFALVLPSAALLVYGMYLTHSRGGIVALLAVTLFAFRRKIGTVPSAILAAGLFAITTVIGWSGGRDVSVEAGADRMEAWSVGLELIKHHPIFGVGFGRFGEYFIITAHNTIVVCAAELGMFGLFWWVMFVLPTVRDAAVSSGWRRKKEKSSDEESFYENTYNRQRPQAVQPLQWAAAAQYSAVGASGPASAVAMAEIPAQEGPKVPLHLTVESEEEQMPSAEEVEQLGRLMVISIVGYFVAGWFLSRAYIMTLFIYGGIVQVIYRMALARNMAPPRMRPGKIMQYSAIASIVLILIVYVMLRLQHI